MLKTVDVFGEYIFRRGHIEAVAVGDDEILISG